MLEGFLDDVKDVVNLKWVEIDPQKKTLQAEDRKDLWGTMSIVQNW